MVRGAFDVGHRLAVDSVVVAEEFVVEPVVQGVHPLRTAVVEGVDVPGLGEPDLALDTVLGEGVPPLAELLGADREVLLTVHDEDARLDLVRVRHIIPLGPHRGPAAWLLTGDAHAAEDLLQTVLARVWPKWSRIGGDNPEAYARRALVNTYACGTPLVLRGSGAGCPWAWTGGGVAWGQQQVTNFTEIGYTGCLTEHNGKGDSSATTT